MAITIVRMLLIGCVIFRIDLTKGVFRSKAMNPKATKTVEIWSPNICYECKNIHVKATFNLNVLVRLISFRFELRRTSATERLHLSFSSARSLSSQSKVNCKAG